MRLNGKVALVSGAHRGIGQGIAERYAKEGAVVYCADIGDCVETVTRIERTQGRARAVHLDVASELSWKTVVTNIIDAEGHLDILANVAAVVVKGTDNVLEISLEEWERVMSVDLRGVWLGMRTALPHMIAAKYGKIVNISSLASLRGLHGLFAYSTAKGGVAAMTRQVAVDYAPNGITVNSIAPGTIDTPILAGITEEMRTDFIAAHAIPRIGLPADIAALAAFLASDDSAFMTGLNIPCDGGWSIS
jgi:NAD(P)-dependent dehydrogenase (short-subunit alcohol dehydrogenase family)